MRFYWLILGVLAVWRVTHLLTAEDGPWGVVVRLRRAAGDGFWGQLLDCFHCLSLWVALPAAGLICQSWKEGIFLWLSFSGGAILLEQLTGRAAPATALYQEDQETDHVMLRKSEKTVPDERTQPPSA